MAAANSKAGIARLGAARRRGAYGTCARFPSQVLDHKWSSTHGREVVFTDRLERCPLMPKYQSVLYKASRSV